MWVEVTAADRRSAEAESSKQEGIQVPIPEAEQRKMFARSGNRCPSRAADGYWTTDVSLPNRLVVLGETAHAVAERPGGPRGSVPLPFEDGNRAGNRILLCTDLHQLVRFAAFTS